MTKPIFYQPERRLATMLRASGGIEVRQALDQASSNLETMRESSLVAIDEKIAALSAALAERGSAAEVYLLTTEIFSLAGVFGLNELSSAAGSLAGMLEVAGKEPDSPVDLQAAPKLIQAVQVHVAALTLLRRMSADGDVGGRQAIIAGLRDVAQRMTKANTDAA